MRVVLLGPNGQLGQDIRRVHEETGHPFDLVPLGRDRLDVTLPGACAEALGDLSFDAVVNCTGYHKTDEVEDNAAQGVAVNAHAVRDIAQACEAKGARLIHVSTDYVFGGDCGQDRPLNEESPPAPLNVYGATKLLGESLARTACEDLLILRVASLFGVAGASGKGGNFVETMIRLGREKGTLRVVNDQEMSPTSTRDAAGIILRMLREGCEPGLYHVVNSGSASWFDFACAIIKGAGVDASVEPCSSAEYPTRAVRPRYSVLDNGRVSGLFGPMPAWPEALECYLAAKGYRSGAAIRNAAGGTA